MTAFCVICGVENDTNGHHLTVFSVDIAFDCHFMVLHQSPIFYPYKRAFGIGYASEKAISKMVGNSATVAMHSIVSA